MFRRQRLVTDPDNAVFDRRRLVRIVSETVRARYGQPVLIKLHGARRLKRVALGVCRNRAVIPVEMNIARRRIMIAAQIYIVFQ